MMQLRRFRKSNKGISTIIAAALIVAMTVIAAVAFGTTMLKIPTPQQEVYNLQLTGSASLSENQIAITVLGGDPINTEAMAIKTYIPSGSNKGFEHTVPNTFAFHPKNEDDWKKIIASNQWDGKPTSPIPLSEITYAMMLKNAKWEDLGVIPLYEHLSLGAGDPPGQNIVGVYGTGWHFWGYTGMKLNNANHATGVYAATLNAGDTLLLKIDQSFGTFLTTGAPAIPAVGEKFVVEFSNGPYISASVVITMQE